jgi:hypothetical protein
MMHMRLRWPSAVDESPLPCLRPLQSSCHQFSRTPCWHHVRIFRFNSLPQTK